MNAVCYCRVVDANLPLSQVQNYLYASSQKAQTTLHSVAGQSELDKILSVREKVNAKPHPAMEAGIANHVWSLREAARWLHMEEDRARS